MQELSKNIDVVDVQQHDDGSATITMHFTEEVQSKLTSIGLHLLLSEYLDPENM